MDVSLIIGNQQNLCKSILPSFSLKRKRYQNHSSARKETSLDDAGSLGPGTDISRDNVGM